MSRVGGNPDRRAPLPSAATRRLYAGGERLVALAASFEDFFELEHEGLFGALYLLTGNRSDAGDLMQLAFLKVWERWSVIQEMDNPTGYLYRTAMNRLRRSV